MLDNPIIAILSMATSVIFTLIAALVPPNAGNLVGGIFVATFGSFLVPEEDPFLNQHEQELEDADI